MQSESEEPGHCAGFSFFCEQHKASEKNIHRSQINKLQVLPVSADKSDDNLFSCAILLPT
jgi:hypothetical protein